MAHAILDIADTFWNIRGTYRTAGVIDVGTQSSLARLHDGTFALLDSYTLADEPLARVLALTDGGKRITAILNLHPFHTLHVRAVHAQFPHAALYGTARHVRKAPDLPWRPLLTESPELHQAFAADFDFTVPRGVTFIPANEGLHFASVLAIHRASRTLHVDDTLNWLPLPLIGGLSFHPTLAQVLEPRPGAAADFRAWANELIERSSSIDHVCTAHAAAAPALKGDLPARLRSALKRVEPTLRAHEKRHG